MSPRDRLIKLFNYTFRHDKVFQCQANEIADTIMDMIDDKYGHLLERENEQRH